MEKIFDTLVSPSSSTGDSPDPGTTDFEAVRKRILGGGRKPSTKRKTVEAETETDLTQKELEKIFAGENWEEVAALYFNARFAITGYEEFQLTDPQRKTLGLSLATTMKMLLKIDPGYIALIVFTANFGGLIAQKEMMYKQAQKQEAKKRGTIAS